MTTMHRSRNWKIQVLGNEHGIPHFHLLWPSGRASIAIENGEVLVGKVPAKLLAEARNWANDHCASLIQEWRRLNPGK
ncbi:DUF4160 domain-containing protein [Endothiovibrio diazotrophicus]